MSANHPKNLHHDSKNAGLVGGLPFVLFIGPQRAGTSWLYRYFVQRRDVCLPLDVKEIFFFDENYERGLDYYKSHFQPKPEHKVALEITTTSFSHPAAPGRILETCGASVRLMCPLREPVMRSYSLYKHYKRYGMVEGTLQEAVQKRPDIIESSRYATHLENWFSLFGRENIYFSFQEHLAQNQEEYVRHICDSIGIAYSPVPPDLSGRYNATTVPPSRFVAAIAQKGADILRSCKLYPVINAAKALGLKKYIFGKENPDADPLFIPDEDRVFLEKALKGELEKLEKLLGFEIKYWKN